MLWIHLSPCTDSSWSRLPPWSPPVSRVCSLAHLCVALSFSVDTLVSIQVLTSHFGCTTFINYASRQHRPSHRVLPRRSRHARPASPSLFRARHLLAHPHPLHDRHPRCPLRVIL